MTDTAQNARLRFTQEEMDIARETDLPDLLSSLGYQVRRVGRYHTTKEMDSLCALAVCMAGSGAALAAGAANASHYYPVSVAEYTAGRSGEMRIKKIYQLSLSDDPSGIPTEDFERSGRTYSLLDLTRKNEIGVDTRDCTKTVTQPSETNDMEKVLQTLDAELEVTDEDGYTGTLRLDHTSVQVTADGYATKTQPLSASRSYPNLSEADVSLIPKAIFRRFPRICHSKLDAELQYAGVPSPMGK